jgi:predicted TIM-barrel fold metal-dependent hydrolase
MSMSRHVIDTHSHANWMGKDVDALVRNMDECGIEKAWLLSWEIPEAEFQTEPYYYKTLDPRAIGMPLWMVVDGLKAYPDRFIAGWAPDFRDRHARSKLFQAVQLHGVKVCGELKLRTRYDHPDGIAMYRYCGELGLPVVLHLECAEHVLAEKCRGAESWPPWYGGDISVLENMCRLCPDTQFLGHAPGFWREISGDAATDPERYPKGPVTPEGRLLRLMRTYPNLNCDISAGSAMTALNRDLEVTRAFFLEFQDRIVFARDSFGREQFDLLEALGLAEDVAEKVFHRNAERLVENAGKGV